MARHLVGTANQPVSGRRAAPGLVLPGLGHLLTGSPAHGVGMMLLTLELLWAAVAGFPRLGSLLSAPGAPGFALHPWVALVVWASAAAALWRQAWRRTRPTGATRSQVRSHWALASRQFDRNGPGVLGLYLVLLMTVMALLAPLIAPHDPIAIDVGPQFAEPGLAWPMGTDRFGRDLFSRVLYGARISLSIGFVSVGLSASIGATLGAIAGYSDGWLDKCIMWVTDLVLSLPRLVVLLAIVGIFRLTDEAGIFAVVAILGLTGWMGVARIVRSQVLSLKEQDFIAATRALGLPTGRIIFRHLIPNALAPVIVHASLAIGGTILVEASLSFLGIGVSPPTATWGNIIKDGKDFLRSAWWVTMFPGLMIALAVMSFNLLGDGLRDALDPKMRGRE